MWAQIYTAVAGLAVIPNLTSGGTAQVLGTVAAVLVVAIGQIGPMCKA